MQVFEVIKKQEETRQSELAAKAAEFKALQAQSETVRSIAFPLLICCIFTSPLNLDILIIFIRVVSS